MNKKFITLKQNKQNQNFFVYKLINLKFKINKILVFNKKLMNLSITFYNK